MSKNTKIADLINYISVDESGNVVLSTGGQVATQSYVTTAVSNLVNSAPSTLDTLNELAAALGNDANFATTVTNSIATKLPLSGGTLTGNLNGTTATFSSDVFALMGVFTRNSADTFIGSSNNTSGMTVNGSTLVTKIISGGDVVATFANGGAATFTNTINATRFISNVTNNYGVVLNRTAVNTYNGMSLQTAGVAQWFLGMRENLSSNNYIIYNENGTDALTISKSNSSATFSGSSSQPIRITSSFPLSSGYADAFQMLFGNQTGGGVSLNIGKSESTRNLAKMVYTHISDGSTSNRLGFGFYDADGLFYIFAGGNISIGGTDSGEKFNIRQGNIKLYTYQNTPGDYRYIGTEYGQGNGNNRAEIRFGIESDTYTNISFHTAAGGGTLNEAAKITSRKNFTFNGTNVPSGLVQEVSGNTPLLGLDVNFRPTDLVNTAYPGAQVRVDMRSGLPPFSFLHRAAGSTTDSTLASIREDGIRFKNGSTSLGYYEEGSWTPSLRGSSSTGSVGYDFRSATYVRIGNWVFVRWGFKINSISGASGNMQITGLPFTGANWGSYQEPNVSVSTGLLANSDFAHRARVYFVGGNAHLEGRIANNGDTGWNIDQFSGDEWVIGEMFYNI